MKRVIMGVIAVIAMGAMAETANTVTVTKFHQSYPCSGKATVEYTVGGTLPANAVAEITDRSIFLPVTGYGSGTNLGSPTSQGYYWSSTPDSDDSHFAWHLYFNSNNFYPYIYYGRQYGLSVRPVRDDNYRAHSSSEGI